MSNEEIVFKELLYSLDKDTVASIISKYIKENRLHTRYINLITELSEDYINKSNYFIERFKMDVNALYVDEQFGKKVLKEVDIDEQNWYWYARLLRDTEDEVYPKRNYYRPTYLLKRLMPIIADLDVSKLKDDEERYELYKVCLDLYEKYGLQNINQETNKQENNLC